MLTSMRLAISGLGCLWVLCGYFAMAAPEGKAFITITRDVVGGGFALVGGVGTA